MAKAVHVRGGENRLSWCRRLGVRRVTIRLSFISSFLVAIVIAITCLDGGWCLAQSASGDGGVIRGVVINSVTHEPIDRALVSSPDHRFATLTDSEGRFEFAVTKNDSGNDGGSDPNRPGNGPHRASSSNRPNSLMARKPGFLSDPNQQGNNLRSNAVTDVTLALTPEAVISGTVALPTAESPDSISLQLFRRQIQDGRGRWVPSGASRSMSDGQFRFAGLPAGTYKLLTSELLDTDPLTFDRHTDSAADSRAPLFGYPPVYYQTATDFQSANPIQLTAGQTQTVDLSLVKKPYYRVKIPVVVPGSDESNNGFSVTVYAGRKGPGFSLGYNRTHHAVEGMLPSGTYTVEVTDLRQNGATGMQTITIKGAPIEGPSIVMAPNGLIAVNVKEEFTGADHSGTATFSSNGNTAVLNGARRYLNVTLDPADDFGTGRSVSLRNPTGPGDEALAIEGAAAGKYWVRVQSSRGYPASIRSGNLDLQHRPLVVGVGGAASPIEITMRDDTAEISGRIEGIAPAPQQRPGGAGGGLSGGTGGPSGPSGLGQSQMHVYCVPLADSGGQFTELWAHTDGTFDSPELAPGAYRVLAFDQVQTEIEYRNPEAMQAYDSKGSVVRLTGGQKERVTLQLISASALSSEQSSEPSNESSSEPNEQ